MKGLKDKKILFFSPRFFGYEIEIKNKLVEMGACVDYYDTRPQNDIFTKGLIRINKKLISYRVNSYYDEIIRKTANEKYDYIFFIVPEALSSEKLLALKRTHKESKFILYMWDSFSNMKNVIELMDKFDDISSFDPDDCNFYSNVRFRPLFYSDQYKEIADDKNDFYDLTFIGTAHSDRYSIIKNIEKSYADTDVKIFSYMYLQSKVYFMFLKLFNGNFKNANVKDIKFQAIDQDSIINIIKTSKTIIDIHHPKQNGLTIRTIEMLGAKRKLITTNERIQEYDFYSPQNIYIIDRNNPVVDENFLNGNYEECKPEVYEKYSIECWIKDVFQLDLE